MYDLMPRGQRAGAMLMYPMFELLHDGNHDAIPGDAHPVGVLGLSDGGALAA